MTGLLTRLVPAAWLRAPRPTARLRLTLLYGALFIVSGAVLLAITYLLVAQAAGGQAFYGSTPPGNLSRLDQSLTFRGLSAPKSTSSQAALLHAQVAALHAFLQHELLIRSGMALGLTAVISIALGWLVAGRVLRPVRTISATARQISASNLDERLSLDGPDDEFRELATTLDDLFGRLQASFDSQRHFVANASHELRTPLTAERTLLQVALDNPGTSSEDWRSTAREVLACNSEQERLIEALLALASSEAGLARHERIDLPGVCLDVLPRLASDITALGLHMETALGPAALNGDPRLIERLVANLIGNSVGHNVTGGHVQVATAVTEGRTALTVTNTGPVIPGGEVSRLFQPFQRLDPGRAHHKDGHGLGLSIVRAIADAHDATITATPRPHGGLRIEVSFPGRALPRPSRSGRAAGFSCGSSCSSPGPGVWVESRRLPPGLGGRHGHRESSMEVSSVTLYKSLVDL
jgi:signal transduction histidine kinase